MPTYEYRCPEGHEFEHFVRSIREGKAELICPVCGKTAERRVSAGGGLVFKGSGFYITDYGKDGKKDLRGTSPPSTSRSTEKTDATESKPSETKPSGEKKTSTDSGSSE